MKKRLCSLASGFGFLCLSALASERPNILFIVSEDNGPELGCYGDQNAINHNITPTLDQMARDGVLFYNAAVPYSVCSPSRACFYTGTHVAQNGHEGLQSHNYRMYEEYPTYLKLLQENGYRTGLLGKLHIAPGGVVTDYVDYRSITGSNFQQGGRNMRNYADKARDFITGNYGSGVDSDDPFCLTINYPDAHLTMHHLAPSFDVSQANTLPKNPIRPIAFQPVDTNPDENIEDWVMNATPPLAPKTPLQGPDFNLAEDPFTYVDNLTTIPWVGVTSDRLLDQTAGYYNCLRRLDDGIKMVLDELATAGKLDNTLIIYIGDHGAQFARGKTSVYEAGLRVPFIVKWPGNTVDLPDEFNHRQELVSTIDVMPTILQAAGINIPDKVSGMALQPLLMDKEVPWRKYTFGHTNGSHSSSHYTQLSVRGQRYKLIYNPYKEPTMPESLRSLRNYAAQNYLSGPGAYTAGCRQHEIDQASTPQHVKDAYARYLNPPLYELYDLESDPYEWYNLAEEFAYAEIKQELIDALDAWQSDPLIADPLRDLGNVERFGLMLEQYRPNGGKASIWDFQNPNVDWNFMDWRAAAFPQYEAPEPPVQPVPPALYSINFENAEGFTFPATDAFAAFPAGTTTDTSGGVWAGDGGSSGIWNRSDIPPEGVQALRIGATSGNSEAILTLPPSVNEVGMLRFAYANYSGSTNCTATVSVREVGTTAWTEVWSQQFTGLQVDWKNKPWPFAQIEVNLDGRHEIRFASSGSRGFKVDQLLVTEKYTPIDLPDPVVPIDYADWRVAQFSAGDASNDLISGPDADPDQDGHSNRLEFVLGMNPLGIDSWEPNLRRDANGYTTLDVPGTAATSGDWILEYSTDMENWYTFNRRRLMDQDEGGYQLWQLAIPPMEGAERRIFFRVRER